MSENKATRRGRIQLIAVTLIFVLPVVVALVTTKVAPNWNPLGTANYGTLVNPVIKLDTPGLKALDGIGADKTSLLGHWSLLMFSDSTCAETCLEQLYLTQQVRLLLNKDSTRVQRWLVFTSSSGHEPTVKDLMNRYAGLRLFSADSSWRDLFTVDGETAVGTARIYLVDPQGYLMMYFVSDFDPQSMLKDLKRLLKTSRLG